MGWIQGCFGLADERLGCHYPRAFVGLDELRFTAPDAVPTITHNAESPTDAVMYQTIVMIVAALLATTAHAGLLDFMDRAAADYDECILQGMKGVTSDVAAREIKSSCRSKFPAEPTRTLAGDSAALTVGQRAKLSGRAGFQEMRGSYYAFVVSLYNGTENCSITSIKIALKWKDAGQSVSRLLLLKAVPDLGMSEGYVDPLSEGRFKAAGNFGKKKVVKLESWTLVDAYGLCGN